MPGRSPEPAEISRRIVLRSAAMGGVALPLLAACGDDPESTQDAPTTSAGDTAGGDTGGGSPDAGGDGGGGGNALASTTDVPVGGGQILGDEQIVLTQPAKDDFKAFSSVCTHQQCNVNAISDGVIQCPCHGSQFSIEDGSVVGGPAPEPLPEVAITVEGGNITRA